MAPPRRISSAPNNPPPGPPGPPGPPASSSTPNLPSRNTLRYMTVDNVLGYASAIPSGQPRQPPTLQRPGLVSPPLPQSGSSAVQRRPSFTGAAGARGAGAGAGAAAAAGGGGGGGGGAQGGSGAGAAHPRAALPLPSRTTKISEKLVLLPETTSTSDEDETDAEPDKAAVAAAACAAHAAAAAHHRRLVDLEEDASAPLRDEELDVLRKRGGIRGKSYAERLPKPRRAAEKVSRVTAYCTAEAFKVKEVADFVRKQHGAKAKLYDDCLYTIYALPLLPGTDGFRIRSKPILRTPGSSGKTVLDLEIERNENRVHHEGFFDEYGYGGGAAAEAEAEAEAEAGRGGDLPADDFGFRGDAVGPVSPVNPVNRLAPDAKNYAEMFVFAYGVVVFWNFTEPQEKDILADLTFAGQYAVSQHQHQYHHNHNHNHQPEPEAELPADPKPPMSLMTRPLLQEDVETEQFHFEYSADVARPRVFNDMITLLPRSDHMVKLTISHAIAQSTKLGFIEERMAETMLSAHGVPKSMAITGQLNMERKEVLKMMGHLFKNRVEINLSSNILDVPNFFWDSEPNLHPLYVAIRDYLEIDPRIKVLNERCQVFLNLSEILSDSIADSKMSLITWIIIVLIVVSIVIESFEIVLRTAILRKASPGTPAPPMFGLPNGTANPHGRHGRDIGQGAYQADHVALIPQKLASELPDNVSLDDLRRWNRMLAQAEREYVCGEEFVDRHVGRSALMK